MESKTCIEPGCDKPVCARRLCITCYQRHWQAGALPPLQPCPVPGCLNDRWQKGPCKFHREQFASAEMKWCTNPKCSSPLKAASEFYRKKSAADGLDYRCKSCVRLYEAERWRSGDAKAWEAQYYAKRKSESPGWQRGLSDEQYRSMWTTQNGQCPICSKKLDPNGDRSTVPQTDHDHFHCPDKRGCPECFRSFLCVRCNTMLGHAHDDPVILRRWKPTKRRPQAIIDAAITYLEKWHAEMSRRGIRPPPEEAMWSELFAAATRLLLGISPS